MSKLLTLKKELRSFADPERAKNLARFFKTGPGEYGQGDKFIGVRVPQIRTVAKKFASLSFSETKTLLRSPIHEERLTATLLLVHKFQTQDPVNQKNIYSFYLKNSAYINNWDLVDLSAPNIVGQYLLKNPKEKSILTKLAKSKNLWQKRISILATFTFIKNHQFTEALRISKILLRDNHDLIHKAVGWMLREVGNRSIKTEEEFLAHHYKTMPRTMLRYAIEKFPEKKRLSYLRAKI